MVSAMISVKVFERIPHLEDEFSNLWEAEIMAKGQIDSPSPPFPSSFLVPFVVDYQGRRFSKYAPGWPATLSLGARIGAPWLVNSLLAGLAVWLTYRLGSKVVGREVGLIAALLTGSSPMFLMLSGSMLSHLLSLVLVITFTLTWLDLFPHKDGEDQVTSTPTWLIVTLAGAALGMLVLTRPLTAFGVALPFIIHGLILFFRGDRATRRRLLALGGLSLGLAALLPLWQAALTGDPTKNLYTLWWEYDRVSFGPGHGHSESGHTLDLALVNLLFSLRAGQHDLFGWPYLSWLFIPFGLLALRRSRDGWLIFSIIPSLLMVYTAYWVGSWLFGPRYYFEALPGLAVVSAAGVLWLGGWVGETPRPSRLRRTVAATFFLFLLGLNFLIYLPIRFDSLRGLYGIERERMRPLQEADLGNALVIVQADQWMEYGAVLTLTQPFTESELLLAWTNIPERINQLVQAFQDREIYYYYPDEPNRLYTRPREGLMG